MMQFEETSSHDAVFEKLRLLGDAIQRKIISPIQFEFDNKSFRIVDTNLEEIRTLYDAYIFQLERKFIGNEINATADSRIIAENEEQLMAIRLLL